MRIVITRNGKKIVHEFEDELPENSEKQKSNYIKSSYMTKFPVIYSSNEKLLNKYKTKNNEFLHKVLRYRDTFQSKRSSSIVDKTALESFYNRDESKINLNELSQARRIKLSQPKINMSQAFLDKYDDYDINLKKKLTELSNNLISKNSSPQKSEESKDKEKNNEGKNTNIDNNINQNINSNINLDSNYGFNSSSFSNKPNKINLGKIISRNNLITLRKQISKYNKGPDDNRIFLDEQNIRSYNFRSRFENKQATEEDMDLILNYSINPEKQSIIKYFQQEKNISPQYFENLLKYDEPQMYKLNKICQMIFRRKEDEKKFNILKFNELKRDKEKFNRQKGGQNLKALQNIIKRSNSILDDYTIVQNNHNFWRKHGYKEDVVKIKEKFWDKYNVDRFLKNKQRMEMNKLAQTTKNCDNELLNKKLFSSQSTPDMFYKTKI